MVLGLRRGRRLRGVDGLDLMLKKGSRCSSVSISLLLSPWGVAGALLHRLLGPSRPSLTRKNRCCHEAKSFRLCLHGLQHDLEQHQDPKRRMYR